MDPITSLNDIVTKKRHHHRTPATPRETLKSNNIRLITRSTSLKLNLILRLNNKHYKLKFVSRKQRHKASKKKSKF